jgi:hypothetical protein
MDSRPALPARRRPCPLGLTKRLGVSAGSKFTVKIPRVRNTATNHEVPLESYQRLQQPLADDEGTILKLLHGLTTHKYQRS